MPYWPGLIPDITPEALDYAVAGGLICGDPDEALKQCQVWESAGADQLVFGVGMATQAEQLETIRLMEVGFGMVMAGRLDRARALLDRSLLLNPQPYDDFFIGLGILEFARGDHARAKSYFDLTASPDIWGIVFTAANGNTGGCADPALAAQARAAIAAIWPSDRPFETESVVAWVASHNPFRDPGVEHRFLTAVRQILIGR